MYFAFEQRYDDADITKRSDVTTNRGGFTSWVFIIFQNVCYLYSLTILIRIAPLFSFYTPDRTINRTGFPNLHLACDAFYVRSTFRFRTILFLPEGICDSTACFLLLAYCLPHLFIVHEYDDFNVYHHSPRYAFAPDYCARHEILNRTLLQSALTFSI